MINPQTTRIMELSWGHMQVVVNGETLIFKDCKVWPGGASAWDWTLTGTRHQPGIQPTDIAEIMEHDIEILILSRGMHLKLQTCPETEQFLREQGIIYHIEETQQAVTMFNALMEAGKKVGGIFHSTC